MDTTQLQKRIEALEKWKADREKQQIVYPLDVNSQVILNRYFMHITDTVTTVGGAAGHEFTTYLGQQGQQTFEVSQAILTPYSVDATTNIFTVNSYLRFFDDNPVGVLTSDTAPAPLVVGVTYYVRDSDGQSFKLAATVGGAAIDITDTGTGRQFIQYE